MNKYPTIRSFLPSGGNIDQEQNKNICQSLWQEPKNKFALSPEGAARVAEETGKYKAAEAQLRQKMPQLEADTFMRTAPTIQQMKGAEQAAGKKELERINKKWRLSTGWKR